VRGWSATGVGAATAVATDVEDSGGGCGQHGAATTTADVEGCMEITTGLVLALASTAGGFR
jgi:hypothetical protein